MIYALVSLICVVVVFWIILKKRNIDLNKTNNVISKVLAIVLFVCYAGTWYYNNAIDYVAAMGETLFSKPMLIWIIILRWFTMAVTSLAILIPFYKSKSLKTIVTYLGPITAVLNIIFFKENMIAYFGTKIDPMTRYNTYFWIAYQFVLLVTSLSFFMVALMNKEYKEIKIKRTLFILVLLIPVFFGQGTLYNIFGPVGSKTVDFKPIHRISIYFSFIVLIGLYVTMRHKSIEDKNTMFAVLTFSGLVQFFYVHPVTLSGLPLHLCNAAIIMMFFAFVFKMRGVFYFTYFVNVIGAIVAMMMPNIDMDAFTAKSVHFWYTHIYAFALPILGVALGVYPRPNLKMMRGAIGAFTLYYILVVVANAQGNGWIQSLPKDPGYTFDFFFTYGDHVLGKVEFALPLKYNFILDIQVGDLTWRFYYMYQIVFYIAYIFLMFIIWIIYDYLYKVSDAHYKILEKKKIARMDMVNLRKELNGRKITEPLDLGGIKMIKIENYSKIYGSSKRKAVDNFNLTVNNGEIFGFLGHNGAGKSTTIKSIVGIHGITSGRILVDGYDVAKQPLEAKLRIGYVSDNHAVYEKLTGREYINYVADLYLVSKEDRDQRIEKYVKMFKLEDAIDNEIKSYSHGMKQKIVVIASLIHDPKVWVLDEPLTGLDPASSYQIKECMREHARKGNIVFFSSHVIEVVEKICDKICIISHGKLQGIYELADLKAKGIALEELYINYVAKEGK